MGVLVGWIWGRIPRLYAAASLKHDLRGHFEPLVDRYSAALCRGLIEATPHRRISSASASGIPRLYAAASLKLVGFEADVAPEPVVFRGSMPRPH